MICGLVKNHNLVFLAASLTLGIFIGLTIYALTTKNDFTLMGVKNYIFKFNF